MKTNIKRLKAIKWWRGLGYEVQLKKCTVINRNPNTLTSSEIEKLYKKRIKNWNKMESVMNPFI